MRPSPLFATVQLMLLSASLILSPFLSTIPVFVPTAEAAALSVEPATGGDAIDASTVGGSYTPLTKPKIKEGSAGEIGVGTIILNAPAGFEFDTGGITPTVKLSGGSGDATKNTNHITNNTAVAVDSVTTTQITFTITFASTEKNDLTWQDIRVRPTAAAPLASGNITVSGTSAISGVDGTTNFGTLTEVGVTVTPATGGSAIPSSTAGGTFTTLTGPVLAENATADIGDNDAGTIILNAPAGFEFDTGGTAPTVLITRIGGSGADNRNINDRPSGYSEAITSRTATTITFTVAHKSSNGVTNSLTWQDIRVRPTAAAPLASGTITISGVSTIVGVNSSTNLGTLTEVASLTSTVTVVSSSTNPSTYGTSVTFTATVTGSSPTGSVEFFDGAASIGSGALAGGSGSVTTSLLGAATHSITAIYSGDGSNSGSTSIALSQVVNPATLTVTADDVSRDYGAANPVFTASYSGFVNGEVLGTSDVAGAPGLTTAATPTSPVSGSPYVIAAGTGSLTSTNYLFTFVDGQLTVNPVGTTTNTVLSLPNASIVGDPVTLTGSVSGGFNPTGDVQFLSGSVVIGTGSLASGSTMIIHTFTTVGSYSITAQYLGDGNNNPSTSGVATLQVVNKANPVTSTVLSAPNASIVGDPVTLTGSVSGGFNPTGTLEFLSGATVLGSSTLSGGSASVTFIFTAAGNYNLTAHYIGDASNNESTSAATTVQVVDKALPSTSTAIGVPNASVVGDTVLFTATVSGGYLPTGEVNFLSGSIVLGSGSLLAGSATFSHVFSVTGDYSIHAEYLGDGNNLGSSSPDAVIQVVDKFASSVDLSTSTNLSFLGNEVTLTAVVTGFFPSGTVTFRDGGTDLGTVTLSNESGSLLVSSLALGSHFLEAVYSGDHNNLGSTSTALEHIVSAQPPENGGSRGHNITTYSSVAHFVLANAGGGGGRGRGNIAPGAFGGQGDNVILPRQQELLCTLQRSISPSADSSLIIWLARYLSPFFALRAEIIEQALQNPGLCAGASAALTPRLAITAHQQVMPVDQKGIPLSTNAIWNRCIRNGISISATDLSPLSCDRYHEGHYWTHPDSGITFFWSDRHRQQLVAADRQPLLVLPVK